MATGGNDRPLDVELVRLGGVGFMVHAMAHERMVHALAHEH